MESSCQLLWSKCEEIIKDNLPEDLYAQWIAPIVPCKYEDQCLWIQVPSHFFYEQIEKSYSDLIGKALQRAAGAPTRLMYRVSISDTSVNIASDASVAHQPLPVPVKETGRLSFLSPARPSFDSQLIPSLQFSNFVEGESNRLSRSAGLSIAARPGTTIFNPLFVYGRSGVGKTHLLHAIGNATLEQNPNARVLYISSHVFQVQYSQAYLDNKINDFIHFYQSVDVLLVDDIHELSGKTGTQNVFFHIFNHLHQLGKQIVFTCDRAPKDLKGVEERLLTRFKWGLTDEIKQPDQQLRADILRYKIRHEGLDIDNNIVEYIARHAKDNVRDLEGILTSLVAHSIIDGCSIDMELCREVVNNCVEVHEDTKLTVENIEDEVCRFYHMDRDTLHSRSKKQEVAQARQIAMYLAKKYTDSSLAHIGEIIGGRNHATVIHACKTIADWMETNQQLKGEIGRIESALVR